MTAQETVAPARLAPREVRVLDGVARGLTNRAIAADLCLSEHTVKSQVARILHKLGAADRAHAVAIAMRAGIIR